MLIYILLGPFACEEGRRERRHCQQTSFFNALTYVSTATSNTRAVMATGYLLTQSVTRVVVHAEMNVCVEVAHAYANPNRAANVLGP